MEGPIIIIAEQEQDGLRPVTWELVAFARKIQSYRSAEIRAVVAGDHMEDCARHLSETCGIPVTVVGGPRLAGYSVDRTKSVWQDVLKELNPSFVCIAHSSRGADFAPGLAFRLSAACISGVEGVCTRENEIIFKRAIFGGKAKARITPLADRVVITLQPGSMRPDDVSDKAQAQVNFYETALPQKKFEALSVKPARAEGIDLSQAKVLIAAGRGVGEEENLEAIRNLAAVFPQSAVCGSRPIIDAGWMGYSRQVGTTGATVSPALYLACGISGAVQHASGMRGSGFVVSINTDPGAAIFNDSDICIVEDLTVFIPQFVEVASKSTSRLERSGR